MSLSSARYNSMACRRTICHRSNCEAARPADDVTSAPADAAAKPNSVMGGRPGDWTCSKCGNINFSWYDYKVFDTSLSTV